MTVHTNCPLPSPLYSCAVHACAGEMPFPADDLYYWEGRGKVEPGWYCDGCLDGMEVDSSSLPRLDQEIARRDASIALLAACKSAEGYFRLSRGRPLEWTENDIRHELHTAIAKAEGE